MSSRYLPERLPFQSQGKLARAARAQESAELSIFESNLQVRVRAEMELAESRAVADVVAHDMEKVMDNYDLGMDLAGGDVAKIEIAARYIGIHSRIGTTRICRRFGGQ